MDAFSYLSVLLSIILGLAITQVLQGYRSLLLARRRIRLYAPSLLWSGLLLVFSAQMWWASFGLAGHDEWTFANFAVILLQTILLYMMTALVFPDTPADGSLDLQAHYYREVTPFFATLLAMLGVSLLKDWMIDGRLPAAANVAFHAVFAATAITALLVRRPRVHEWIAPVTTVFTATYIALLFSRLG